MVKGTEELKERQETPDSPEALACVPCLQLSDIPRGITKVCGGVCLVACVLGGGRGGAFPRA